MLRLLGIVVVCVFHFSCGKSIVGGDIDSSPEHNFEVFWREFNDFYALFETKNVDWDALYRVHRPFVTEQTTQQVLFGICALMLEYLNDRHVGLVAPFGRFVSGRRDEPLSFDLSGLERDTTITIEFGNRGGDESFDFDRVRTYIDNIHTQGGLQYGTMRDRIGYIFIPGFSTGSVRDKDWGEDIDAVLEQLRHTAGIIIDLRQNSGGVTRNVRAVMARFVDKTHVYGYAQYPYRANPSDSAPLFELQIEPSGARQYTDPLVLLVGKNTASAAEHFVLALRQFPHVTVIGSSTAGALGSIKQGQLPNGWLYQLTVSKFVSADRMSYEGIGIPPDIAISFSDSSAMGDPVLERGIEVLEGM